MTTYLAVLRTPGALRFALPGLVGRLPMGMLSLAIVMLVAATTGRYGLAGAVSAVGALAYAAVTPQVARLVDRYGQRRVLRPQAVVFGAAAVALAACALGHTPVWTLFAAGGLTRAAMPPLGSMVRARWSHALADRSLRQQAFSLEAIADELIFIGGPVLVVALVGAAGPVYGVLGCVGLGVAGVLAFCAARRTEPLPARQGRAAGGALRSPGLLVHIGMHLFLGAMFSAVDLATVAFAAGQGRPGAAGPILAAYGVGSAVGGVWYGSRRFRAALPNRLAVALAATVLPTALLVLAPGVWWLTAAIFVAGLGISATLICSYTIVESIVPATCRTEGMTWLSTAAAIGTALGAPVGGHLVDAYGATAGYLFAFGAGVAALGLLLACRPRLVTLVAAAT